MPNPEAPYEGIVAVVEGMLPVLSICLPMLIIASVASIAFFTYRRKRHSYYTPQRMRAISLDRVPGNYSRF